MPALPPRIVFYKEKVHRNIRNRLLIASYSQFFGLFSLRGCAFKNASCVATRLPCPPPCSQDRFTRRALVNGNELKVCLLLPMAPFPLIRRLQPFIKLISTALAVKGQEPQQQQVLSNSVSPSKFLLSPEKGGNQIFQWAPGVLRVSEPWRLEQL